MITSSSMSSLDGLKNQDFRYEGAFAYGAKKNFAHDYQTKDGGQQVEELKGRGDKDAAPIPGWLRQRPKFEKSTETGTTALRRAGGFAKRRSRGWTSTRPAYPAGGLRVTMYDGLQNGSLPARDLLQIWTHTMRRNEAISLCASGRFCALERRLPRERA